MGLYSVLKKIKEKEKELRILVLGLDNAGKTTLLKRLSGEPLDSISPTFGFNIQTLNYKGYKLNIWDVGGQKSIRTFWRNYFESTEGVIWVVDCADKRRLLECSKELHSIIQQERLSGASLLVMANKQDLARSLTEEQVKEVLELNKVEGHNWKIIGCSATTGHGLLEGINWIVSDIACRLVRYT